MAARVAGLGQLVVAVLAVLAVFVMWARRFDAIGAHRRVYPSPR